MSAGKICHHTESHVRFSGKAPFSFPYLLSLLMFPVSYPNRFLRASHSSVSVVGSYQSFENILHRFSSYPINRNAPPATWRIDMVICTPIVCQQSWLLQQRNKKPGTTWAPGLLSKGIDYPRGLSCFLPNGELITLSVAAHHDVHVHHAHPGHPIHHGLSNRNLSHGLFSFPSDLFYSLSV